LVDDFNCKKKPLNISVKKMMATKKIANERESPDRGNTSFKASNKDDTSFS
jgi:hypothetical protein